MPSFERENSFNQYEHIAEYAVGISEGTRNIILFSIL